MEGSGGNPPLLSLPFHAPTPSQRGRKQTRTKGEVEKTIQFKPTRSKRKRQIHVFALGQPRWAAGTLLAKKLASLPQHFSVPPQGAAATFLPLLAKIGVALLMEKAGVILQVGPGWGTSRASFKGHSVTQPKKASGRRTKT